MVMGGAQWSTVLALVQVLAGHNGNRQVTNRDQQQFLSFFLSSFLLPYFDRSTLLLARYLYDTLFITRRSSACPR